jgi:hypothetical protein
MKENTIARSSPKHPQNNDSTARVINQNIVIPSVDMENLSMISIERQQELTDQSGTRQVSGISTDNVIALSIPSWWKDVLFNEKGQLVWQFKNTAACKIFGHRFARYMFELQVNSKHRFRFFQIFMTVCNIIWLLGLYQLVPMELFLFATTYTMLYGLYVLITFTDVKIARIVMLSDLRYIIQVIAGVIFCVCFGLILDWDYRAYGGILVLFLGIAQLGCIDSWPFELRLDCAVLFNFLVSATGAVLIITITLGLVPDQLPSVVLLTITGVGKWPITFSAYSSFTESGTTIVALSLTDLATRLNARRKPGLLRAIKIDLKGSEISNYGEPWLDLSIPRKLSPLLPST